MNNLNENTLEQTVLSWFEEMGYAIAYGPDISPDGNMSERDEYDNVALEERLRSALESINPQIPESAIDDAIRKVLVTESPSLVENNRKFHRMLTEGIDVSCYLFGIDFCLVIASVP